MADKAEIPDEIKFIVGPVHYRLFKEGGYNMDYFIKQKELPRMPAEQQERKP